MLNYCGKLWPFNTSYGSSSEHKFILRNSDSIFFQRTDFKSTVSSRSSRFTLVSLRFSVAFYFCVSRALLTRCSDLKLACSQKCALVGRGCAEMRLKKRWRQSRLSRELLGGSSSSTLEYGMAVLIGQSDITENRYFLMSFNPSSFQQPNQN